MTSSLTDAPPDQMLTALSQLFAECRRHGVVVSHWKSNSHLAEAVQGRTDLDLLVDREFRVTHEVPTRDERDEPVDVTQHRPYRLGIHGTIEGFDIHDYQVLLRGSKEDT